MSSTEIEYVRGGVDATPDKTGDYVLDKTTTNTGQETYNLGSANSGAYRRLHVSLSNGSVVNDSTDTETVTLSVVDGLEVARGAEPSNATVLDYDGDVTVTIDGVETTKTLTSGTTEFDVTTAKSAGSTIGIVAESLADHPAESSRATIEVLQ
jgi:hypothetical protein